MNTDYIESLKVREDLKTVRIGKKAFEEFSFSFFGEVSVSTKPLTPKRMQELLDLD